MNEQPVVCVSYIIKQEQKNILYVVYSYNVLRMSKSIMYDCDMFMAA